MKRVFLLMLSAMVLLTSCGTNPTIKKVEKYIDIDLSSADVISEHESHGGFNGDGTTFLSLQCIGEIGAEIAENDSFRKLPLSADIGIMLYGSDYVMYSETSRSPLSDGDHSPLFPKIENGFYYFLDLYPQESKEPFDTDGFLDRYSFNFVIAIYDSDTDILYFCKFDT